MLVLHDVTELRRLETVRRDFVANVSHELRTPLTRDQGLRRDAARPGRRRARHARSAFCQVIDRHSERLGRLINDLLTLVRPRVRPHAAAAPPPLAVEPVDRRRRADPGRAVPRSAACALTTEVDAGDAARATPTATSSGRC